MESIEDSIIKSLDGSANELLPFIPYILQDLWEFGTSAEVIVNLFREIESTAGSNTRLLDLGCGKGAVSIKLAKAFGFAAVGIDGMPDFIEFASQKAIENGVSHLCSFYVGDIRKEIDNQVNFDIVVLGAIGTVFGNLDKTLKRVSNCLNMNGIIVLDDGYLLDNKSYINEFYLSQSEYINVIQTNGYTILAEYKMEKETMQKLDNEIFTIIVHRLNELIEKYPDKKLLFEDYVNSQLKENDVLENQLQCSIFVLQKKNAYALEK